MKLKSFVISVAGTTLALTAFCSTVGAQEPYPHKPIRLLVPFAPGGIFDYIARLVSPHLSKSMQQMIITDNRPGGGGMIAIVIASKAAADGYTVLLAEPSIVVFPSLHPKVPYDLKDFTAVTVFTTAPFVMAVHAKVPARNVQELVTLAKSGKLSYGSAGIGTAPHIAGELFKIHTKTDILHVPFKGVGPAVAAIVAEQVHLVFGGVAGTLSFLRDGRLRGLATTGEKRASALPDLPTVAESGYPGYEASVWSAVFVPRGTPQSIISRLNSEFKKVLQESEVKSGLSKVAIEPLGTSAQEATVFVSKEFKRLADLIKVAGIKPE